MAKMKKLEDKKLTQADEQAVAYHQSVKVVSKEPKKSKKSKEK